MAQADLRSDETKYLDAEIARAVAAERERCAQLAERKATHYGEGYELLCREIAEEIRIGAVDPACTCGAPTDGNWANVHAGECPAANPIARGLAE